MTYNTHALDITGLSIFPLGLNQELLLIKRRATEKSKVSPPPLLARLAIRIEGRLDGAKLQDELSRLVARHPALRSSFSHSLLLTPTERRERLEAFKSTGALEPGVFVQTVHDDAVPAIAELDWSGMNQAERETAIRQWASKEDLRPFKDSDRLRVRISLIRNGIDDALLVLVFDRLVFDDFSEAIIRSELAQSLCTPSDRRGNNGALVAPSGFPVFAAWQQQALRTSFFRHSIAFWRDQWAEFSSYRIPFGVIPFSRPAPERPDYTCATEHIVLSASESAAVEAFGNGLKQTPFTVFLAAFAIILSQYTGRSSVVIWSHLANRVQSDTVGSVGFFANAHILGIDLSVATTGDDVVRHVGRVVSAAQAHEELPLPYLWSALKCYPRFPDAQIVMDFITLNKPVTNSLSGMKVEPLELADPTTPRFSALEVYVVNDSDTTRVSVTYSCARFSQPGIAGLLTDLRNCVLKIISDPGAACRKPAPGDRQRRARMDEFIMLHGAGLPRPE